MLGWLSGTESDEGLSEYGGVGLAGKYGVITIGTNWGSNMSFYSGFSTNADKTVKRYQNLHRPSLPPLDTSKVYLTYVVMESGDSPIYWYSVQRQVWSDPARGKLPIGWSLGPTTFELFAPIMEYYYQNATPNDSFFLALSGWGYCHPYRNLMAKTKRPQTSWQDFLAITQTYLDRLELDQISLYTDAWFAFDRKKQDVITGKFARLRNVDAIFMGMGRDENALELGPNYLFDDKTVVCHVVTRWDEKNIGRSEENNQWLIDEIWRNTPSCRPAFIAVHPLSWSYYPSDLLFVTEKLGQDYVVVSPPDFVELFKQSKTSVK